MLKDSPLIFGLFNVFSIVAISGNLLCILKIFSQNMAKDEII